ncbi:N-carbamoylputrescine amidase [Thalassoporum mexicanum PCC 7367]|uniref:N-carbamoylputrescine amidase n=1 Tax=Thalassoporum mexicanum TaxID=3457544 RepID=UPI00029FF63A|nr:N-carbamoylputrescine amidase [Pseudanabaena sp. PCC 7367]AFY71205.1 N-carbamoylputrescine amidase [Pseudanabaena sp. PCC 7367]
MPQSQPVKVAVLQAKLNGDRHDNIAKIIDLAIEASGNGANIILIPELFEGKYFCNLERDEFFAWAKPAAEHPTVKHFQAIADKLNAVIPVPFFEQAGQAYYNSVATIDATGEILGIYRKSHIPDGPGYEEKFYFRPGNSGFKVWPTVFGKVGVGICWDQWFPECARAMVMQGADILLYPTAIGSEPDEPDLDTRGPWQRAMVGHAVSNIVPVAAANRIGREAENQFFYGHSFIANHRGDIVAQLGAHKEGVGYASFDFAQIRRDRASFGFFRDRRPELYSILVTADGET